MIVTGPHLGPVYADTTSWMAVVGYGMRIGIVPEEGWGQGPLHYSVNVKLGARAVLAGLYSGEEK